MKKKMLFGALLGGLLVSAGLVNTLQAQAMLPNDAEKNSITVQEPDALRAFSSVEAQTIPKWDAQQNLLVVLVEFEDVALSSDEADWYDKIFGEEKSLNTYYQEQTGGKITITPANETYGENNGIVKIKVNQKHPNAGMGVSVWQTMENVLKEADPYIDFAEYDTKSGITHAITQDELHIMAIFAGKEISRRNDSVNIPGVWGHKGDFGAWTLTDDGKYLLDYSVFGEKMFFDAEGTLSTLGVIAHEFGHDLKLPDLYNTTYNGLGLGYANVMAWGGDTNIAGEKYGETPTGFSAYSKQQLGVPVETVDVSKEDQIYSVKTIMTEGDDPSILRINTDNPKEYFLIENRQFEGFDKGMYRPQIYSGGIAIYKVNTAFSGNHSVGKQMVTLLEAEQNIVGYSKMDAYEPWFGDPFYYVGTGKNKKPQATTVNGTTNPSTKLADGSTPDFSIEVLDAPASTMQVKISKNRPVESIAFDYETKELEIGQTFAAAPNFTPDNATNKALTWEVSDNALASIDANGTITALKEGEVTVTATTQDGQKTATFKLTIVRPKVALEDIIVKEGLTLFVGETHQSEVTYVPEEAEFGNKLKWSSKYPSYVTVSQDGVITAKTLATIKVPVTVSSADGTIQKTIMVSVVSIIPGATKQEAVEIEPVFTSWNGTSNQFHTNQSGWVKFKAPFTAMYSMPSLWSSSPAGHAMEVGFENEKENRRVGVLGTRQYTSNSGTKWSELPVYFEKDEYIYLHLYTSIDKHPFYFTVKYDLSNPQPIYTKNVKITNKQNIQLSSSSTSNNFTYTVDQYTTKPSTIQLISDDESVAEVVSTGTSSFKVVGKKPGKTTIRVKETSGSNTEDSIEVTVFTLGESKENAAEITPDFNTANMYSNQSGWLKFKAPESGNYREYYLNPRDTLTTRHQVYLDYFNEASHLGYYYINYYVGGRSAESNGNGPFYYEAGEYVYVRFTNSNKDGAYDLGFTYTK